MKRKYLKPKVFFNASVILAGLGSPNGGSGKLLTLVSQKKITGIISEIILDEILRHVDKLNLFKIQVEKNIKSNFYSIKPAPNQKLVRTFMKIVINEGDSHVLASTIETKSDFLVTLDKKHLLILKNKIKGLNIVTPKELLEIIWKK